MQETTKSSRPTQPESRKLRLIHSPKRKENDDKAKTVNGEPGLSRPQPPQHSRGYGHDAVLGNYQGL